MGSDIETSSRALAVLLSIRVITMTSELPLYPVPGRRLLKLFLLYPARTGGVATIVPDLQGGENQLSCQGTYVASITNDCVEAWWPGPRSMDAGMFVRPAGGGGLAGLHMNPSLALPDTVSSAAGVHSMPLSCFCERINPPVLMKQCHPPVMQICK